MDKKTELLNFFKNYGKSFRDGVQLSKFYGDCALAATPTFVGCLKGIAEVRAALANVAEGQARTGMQSLVPLKIHAAEMDPLHDWTRVDWGAKFKNTGDRLIEFPISYLTRRTEGGFLILAYVAHQDEEKMRRELGLT
jgi:hypothetical protein